jgi:hypothetical protein
LPGGNLLPLGSSYCDAETPGYLVVETIFALKQAIHDSQEGS